MPLVCGGENVAMTQSLPPFTMMDDTAVDDENVPPEAVPAEIVTTPAVPAANT
jgi:hypothetical protein